MPVRDGSTIMVGGFGGAGTPRVLREALARRRLRDLTLISNNADFGSFVYEGGIVRLVCSYPVGPSSSDAVIAGIESGDIELELTPQGTLAEAIRAGGAGLGGVLTPTGVDMEFSARYEVLERSGRRWLLIPALTADVALVKGVEADEVGNVTCAYAGANFNPLMAMAAKYTVAQVDRILPTGSIDPHRVAIPSVLVDAIVVAPPEGT